MQQKIDEKIWNSNIENMILKKWNEERIYDFKVSSNKNFVIDTPPPYPSGRPWHIGAAAHYAQIDMIARTARMFGNDVFFPIGIDRNGLPVEIYTEKKHKIKMRQTDREEFLNLCKVSLDELEKEMIQIMKSIGLSANFDEYYRTDSTEYRTLTQNTFINLWKRGLVYSANRPNNYCPSCGTTIADAEIIYQERRTKLVYLKFRLKNTNEDLIVATTRPELIFACQCIIVNPNDTRYEKLYKKEIIIPLFNREVKILPHHSAKSDFGSGAVMVCSYGDLNDVQVFRELGLKEIVAVDQYGKISENGGNYSTLSIDDARRKIIEDLNNTDYIVKEEFIMHRIPICERSKSPVEIIPMQDYYIKQLDFLPKLREFSSSINFYPEIHRQILLNWLDSVAIDWPISRKRFYGTEIPIWYCDDCKEPILPEPGKYYRPWKDKPPFDKCPKCGYNQFTGDDRTFDTWMDSSISPLFVTKYSKDSEFFSKTFPVQIRPQAKDIVRTWLYYTMLRCYQLTEKLAWSDVWIMGYGVDEYGEKMSKSKGNVIDPFPIIYKHGADTFRFWSAIEANHGQDFRCSEQKIVEAQKFLTKLWNIGRFVSSFEFVTSHESNLLSSDKWILGELSNLVIECIKGYKEYNFFIPASQIREFTWNIFAAHYLELVKSRAYNDKVPNNRNSALYALHKCFSVILLLLAPICPFITDKLWITIYSNESIHLQKFPVQSGNYGDMCKFTKAITEFNSLIWTKKRESTNEIGKRYSLRDPIKIDIPFELHQFKDDLKEMHNIQV
ncbi:MAG: valine--tRNA ligase [Thaumarchaeota archaeon]|nr:MAG: valine--tRNA ligase [Nitrososphaerota archaeon]